MLKKLYGSWIWKYPIFKQLYFIHNWIFKKTQRWDKICKINIWWIKWIFKTNISKSSLSKDILIAWYYEKNISEYVIKNLKSWDIFLDVWANLWYYSIISSKKIWESWRVYAYEPVKENIKYLKENIRINNISNVFLFEHGLWNKNEEINIYINPENNWNDSIVLEKSDGIQEKISIKRFDDIQNNIETWKIRFIKIDVEWYEFEVMKWMKKTLEENEWIEIILEFSPDFYKNFSEVYVQEFIDFLDINWYKSYIFNNNSLTQINLHDYKDTFQIDILLRK